ncbi:MAG: nucleotidyltransferase domain-containing protein [Candidatus Woesearchaeota archaeon]
MFKELNTLNLFLEDPTRSFSVREVARILKISPATASKKLKGFKAQNFLKHKNELNHDLYKANLESHKFKDLKTYYSIRKLKESSLIKELDKFYVKPTIILFGSISKGLDTKSSDIDLVVISENTKEFPKKIEFEKLFEKNLQIFAVSNLKDLKNNHLINNALNGIVLQGHIIWN